MKNIFYLKKSCFQNLFYQYPSLEAGRQAVCSVWACLRMLILQTGPPYCTLTSFPCLYFAFLGTMPPYLILKRPAPVILSPNLNLHLSSFCSNSNPQIILQKNRNVFLQLDSLHFLNIGEGSGWGVQFITYIF